MLQAHVATAFEVQVTRRQATRRAVILERDTLGCLGAGLRLRPLLAIQVQRRHADERERPAVNGAQRPDESCGSHLAPPLVKFAGKFQGCSKAAMSKVVTACLFWASNPVPPSRKKLLRFLSARDPRSDLRRCAAAASSLSYSECEAGIGFVLAGSTGSCSFVIDRSVVAARWFGRRRAVFLFGLTAQRHSAPGNFKGAIHVAENSVTAFVGIYQRGAMVHVRDVKTPTAPATPLDQKNPVAARWIARMPTDKAAQFV